MATTVPSRPRALQRLAELEVEPLSDARWTKIEQAVFARLDRGDEAPSIAAATSAFHGGHAALAWWAAVATAAACALVAALLWWGRGEPALSRISTGLAASHVVLPGVALDVAPNSAVLVSGGAHESQLLVLDRGEITCDVAHRRPGAPFVVQAGEVRVEVIGTRFRVVRDGETARIAVQEGVVKVTSGGRSVNVKAGESWPARPSSLVPSSLPSAVAVPEAAASASPRLRPSLRRGPENRGAEAKPASPLRSLQADFEAASRLEAQRPAESIRLYRELEAGSSSWAQNALFAHGRLEAARGNRSEARRVLTQYLSRFPSGANADDARRLLQRLNE
jgi:FecR protein